MIGELPLKRFRQVVDAINERLVGRDELKRAYIEWQTKTLASFITSTVPKQKKGKHPSEMVKQISLFPEQAAGTMTRGTGMSNEIPGSAEALERMFNAKNGLVR